MPACCERVSHGIQGKHCLPVLAYGNRQTTKVSAVLAPLLDEPALARYPWLSAVRGDLLQQLGRRDEAREAFERAASLTENQADRALMQARAHALRDGPSDQPRADRA